MYCPQCGQQQVSEVVRFCSRCGFPLEGVIHLLASGGTLPVYQAAEGRREMSARRKGVRQGASLMLVGAILVPLLGVLDGFARGPSLLDVLVPLAAILFFVGGPLRMLYAALFEEGAAPRTILSASSYVPPQFQSPPLQGRAALLSPGTANPATGWRSRPNTAELVHPPSVTENTTRLLDDQHKPGSDQ